MQVLYSLPEVAERYGPARAADIFKLAPPDPATDLGTQLAKVSSFLGVTNNERQIVVEQKGVTGARR
jgi:hypothetical protein